MNTAKLSEEINMDENGTDEQWREVGTIEKKLSGFAVVRLSEAPAAGLVGPATAQTKHRHRGGVRELRLQ
jgi:hypothetical protein